MRAAPSSSLAPRRLDDIHAFLNTTSFKGAELFPLAGDASFRRYIRIRKTNQVAMLMDAPPDKEDVSPFLTIAQHLNKAGYSAPEILASDVSQGLLLLEDFGDDSFTTILKNDGTLEQQLYSAAIDMIAQWHNNDDELYKQKLALPTYSRELLMKETGLFSQWFIPQVMPKDKAVKLHLEYTALWQEILEKAPLLDKVFVHRDYHADNLMWLPVREGTRRVGILDFQDAVCGDPAYDLVSLLEDARRDVPAGLAHAMLSRYLSVSGADADRLLLAYAMLAAQRNSKIIGIFTRLAVRDGKTHYLHYLPRVWDHLENNLRHPLLQPLRVWLDKTVPANARRIITTTPHVPA